MLRKIQLMHQMFGISEQHKCKDCYHYIRGMYRDKTYGKCEVYGQSHSDATDMSSRNTACGLYNAPYDGDIEIYTLRDKQRPEEPIEGQISLFDYDL